jgi:hypothetical protein
MNELTRIRQSLKESAEFNKGLSSEHNKYLQGYAMAIEHAINIVDIEIRYRRNMDAIQLAFSKWEQSEENPANYR